MWGHIQVYMHWETYLHGVIHTHKGTHAKRDIYRGCILGDTHLGMHTRGYPHGHMHRGNTQAKYTWEICMEGYIHRGTHMPERRNTHRGTYMHGGGLYARGVAYTHGVTNTYGGIHKDKYAGG
jgi:hypothetical protein